jgi:aminoglycoside/choline kinase family phosphotransferase
VKAALAPDDALSRVDAYLKRTGLSSARAVPLTGDASDRRYFRVLSAGAPTQVLAVHGAPFTYADLPFVNVANLMARIPAPIPRILGHADDLGVLALEDLGDVTLQAHLGAGRAGEHLALYREAVSLIVRLQQRGGDLADAAYLPYGVAFDVDKLTWELDFFAKHFLQAYRGVALTPAERAELSDECGAIVRELAGEPRVLCHRDYHSRNLMLCHDHLYLIDFQDARMGPDTYDLASLLRDSYVDIAEPIVAELIAHFLAEAGRAGDADRYRARFDLMALQRNLKALGTFGYQTTTRQNAVYIQYIPRTLRYARENLLKYPRFARLHEILATHVEEFR